MRCVDRCVPDPGVCDVMCVCVRTYLTMPCVDRCVPDTRVCDGSQLSVEHYGPHRQPLLRLLPVCLRGLDQDPPHPFRTRSVGHVWHDVAGEPAGDEECHR